MPARQFPLLAAEDRPGALWKISLLHFSFSWGRPAVRKAARDEVMGGDERRALGRNAAEQSRARDAHSVIWSSPPFSSSLTADCVARPQTCKGPANAPNRGSADPERGPLRPEDAAIGCPGPSAEGASRRGRQEGRQAWDGSLSRAPRQDVSKTSDAKLGSQRIPDK